MFFRDEVQRARRVGMVTCAWRLDGLVSGYPCFLFYMQAGRQMCLKSVWRYEVTDGVV
jgi:hypothetical protein